MFHVVLYRPEIPQNTGAIIRLCANTGAQLHLIEPLGFRLDEKKARRAGLDYHELAEVQTHAHFDAFLHVIAPKKISVYTTHASAPYTENVFCANEALLFGQETRGLPDSLRTAYPAYRIPMRATSRSLNLANAVSVVVYAAWAAHRFQGGA